MKANVTLKLLQVNTGIEINSGGPRGKVMNGIFLLRLDFKVFFFYVKGQGCGAFVYMLTYRVLIIFEITHNAGEQYFMLNMGAWIHMGTSGE